MKTQEMKSVSAILMLTGLLFLGACTGSGAKKNDTGVEAKEERTEIPGMDIHTATVLGDLELIKQHILAGSDLDEREPAMESTPLISAAVFGKSEVARALVEAGADVNLRNNVGSTALHSAAFLCRVEIVKLLLENGAKKDVVDIYGSTPGYSVAGSFENVRPIYDQFSKDLGPLGLKLDYEYLELTRPQIAEMLR